MDGGEQDDDADRIATPVDEAVRIHSAFNFTEFLALANRVVDDGDSASLAALQELKDRWTAKFGPPLKPVTAHELTPYRMPLRPARRIPRLPTPAQEREILSRAIAPLPPPLKPQGSLLPEPDDAAPLATHGEPFPTAIDAIPPRPLEIESALPPRVSAKTLAMQTRVSPTCAASPTSGEHARADAPTPSRTPQSTVTSPMPIYIGNVPLAPTSVTADKIAADFHNSSRKTLSFVPPTIQNGEVVVRPSLDVIRDGSQCWKTTAVGYFLGKRPYYHHLKDHVRSVWPMVQEVTATSNGFFFFRFKTAAAMEEVIEGGPWMFQGQPIVLQKWEPGMVLWKLKHTQVPVWIKLTHLPVELWTTDGLSTVAGGIGKSLYPDAITCACTRLDFARVCIMLDISSTLPNHIVIMVPKEDGSESACKVDVEYEWLPPKCTTCMSLGHATWLCPTVKPKQPAVSVYVPVTKQPGDVGKPVQVQPVTDSQQRVRSEAKSVPITAGPLPDDQSDKGKAIVLYNAFDALNSLDNFAESSKGPISSPVPDSDD
ncbi:UNVERIFIED_CONTAM: hypothetical protein Slati_2466400 [Sesamum latifolium]|uniref:DUF4283 domain-containing protein n=1 Tax=Sesamum latifolium TaxID=2727402 RepID=A0AAW2WDP5_9LAMI